MSRGIGREAPDRRFGPPGVRLVTAAALVALATLASCAAESEPREYELRGQILELRPELGEVRMRHEEIPGYMEPMTMSFRVRDASLLEGCAPGDLVRGRLLVTDEEAWIASLERVGSAPVRADSAHESEPAPTVDLLEEGRRVPDVTLVDHLAAPWRPSQVLGKAVALTFTYTRCPVPESCPTIDRRFAAAQKAATSTAGLPGRVQFVTVSLDPDYDTPDVLRHHAASLGADLANWTFLTGDREAVESFASRFGVSVMRDGSMEGVIVHTLRTAVITPSGEVAKIYAGAEWTPLQLASDLEAATRR
jgi:protein SCO1